MSTDPKQLYLSLLKQALSFNLWQEPPVTLETFNYRRSSFRRGLISLVSGILALGRMQLVKKQNVSKTQREEGHIWPGYADTMIGLKRLDNIHNCLEVVLRDNVEGDVIETGVWRGGACILMRADSARTEMFVPRLSRTLGYMIPSMVGRWYTIAATARLRTYSLSGATESTRILARKASM